MSRACVSEAEQEAGVVLACRLFAEGDLELDVIGRMGGRSGGRGAGRGALPRSDGSEPARVEAHRQMRWLPLGLRLSCVVRWRHFRTRHAGSFLRLRVASRCCNAQIRFDHLIKWVGI